jgi:hypothetical protein
VGILDPSARAFGPGATAAPRRFVDHIAALDDDDLAVPRLANWGEMPDAMAHLRDRDALRVPSRRDQSHQEPVAERRRLDVGLDRVTDQPTAEEALARLEPLIGEWTFEATWPDGRPWPGGGRVTFE